MNETHQKMINAIIKKAEKGSTDSLALIGVYGSEATGDTHEKSDLDLLILINDPRGYSLADAFILDDTDIGYDLYCTDWSMLERDAECMHAYLSKLLDSQLVYVKDQSEADRLEALRDRARSILNSDERQKKAALAFENAKKSYADCLLSDCLSEYC